MAGLTQKTRAPSLDHSTSTGDSRSRTTSTSTSTSRWPHDGSTRDECKCKNKSTKSQHSSPHRSHRNCSRDCPNNGGSTSSTSSTSSTCSSSSSSSSSSISSSKIHPRLAFCSHDFILKHKKSNNFHKDYKMGKLLGEGGFGGCYVVQKRSTGVWRAVKILVKNTPEAQEEAYAEFAVMSQLDHSNISKVYELYEDDASTYIVTDLYKEGDLFDLVETKKRLNEYDTAQVITSLLQSISYLHKRNLCHRDLKPENILLDGSCLGSIRLIDFGLSRYQLSSSCATFHDAVGSLEYVSPQVLNQCYTKACDVWSIGVVAFVLLAGRVPFGGETDSLVIETIQKGTYCMTEPFWKDISNDCKEFIKLLLTYDEADRPTAEHALEHPWIEAMRVKYLKNNDVEIQRLLREALQALETFQSQECQFKQAVAAVMAAQFFTKSDRKVIDPVFRILDRSYTGKLSAEDLHFAYWYTDFSGKEKTEAQINKIIQEVSFSRSDDISYSEFSAVMMLETGLAKNDRLRDVFDYFDRSHKGNIGWRDLEHVLFATQKKTCSTENHCRRIIAEATDGNKSISFRKFKYIMLPKRGRVEGEQ